MQAEGAGSPGAEVLAGEDYLPVPLKHRYSTGGSERGKDKRKFVEVALRAEGGACVRVGWMGGCGVHDAMW